MGTSRDKLNRISSNQNENASNTTLPSANYTTEEPINTEAERVEDEVRDHHAKTSRTKRSRNQETFDIKKARLNKKSQVEQSKETIIISDSDEETSETSVLNQFNEKNESHSNTTTSSNQNIHDNNTSTMDLSVAAEILFGSLVQESELTKGESSHFLDLLEVNPVASDVSSTLSGLEEVSQEQIENLLGNDAGNSIQESSLSANELITLGDFFQNNEDVLHLIPQVTSADVPSEKLVNMRQSDQINEDEWSLDESNLSSHQNLSNPSTKTSTNQSTQQKITAPFLRPGRRTHQAPKHPTAQTNLGPSSTSPSLMPTLSSGSVSRPIRSIIMRNKPYWMASHPLVSAIQEGLTDKHTLILDLIHKNPDHAMYGLELKNHLHKMVPSITDEYIQTVIDFLERKDMLIHFTNTHDVLYILTEKGKEICIQGSLRELTVTQKGGKLTITRKGKEIYSSCLDDVPAAQAPQQATQALKQSIAQASEQPANQLAQLLTEAQKYILSLVYQTTEGQMSSECLSKQCHHYYNNIKNHDVTLPYFKTHIFNFWVTFLLDSNLLCKHGHGHGLKYTLTEKGKNICQLLHPVSSNQSNNTTQTSSPSSYMPTFFSGTALQPNQATSVINTQSVTTSNSSASATTEELTYQHKWLLLLIYKIPSYRMYSSELKRDFYNYYNDKIKNVTSSYFNNQIFDPCIKFLLDQGLLEKVGATNATTYILTQKGKEVCQSLIQFYASAKNTIR